MRELQPGQEDRDDQVGEAIQTCQGLVFLMTPDRVAGTSACKNEWVWALKYKKRSRRAG